MSKAAEVFLPEVDSFRSCYRSSVKLDTGVVKRPELARGRDQAKRATTSASRGETHL